MPEDIGHTYAMLTSNTVREKDRKLYLRLLKGRASCLRPCKLTRKLLCLPILSAGQLRSIHFDATAESKAVQALDWFQSHCKNRSYASNYCNLGQLIEVGYAAGNTSCSRSGRLNCRSAPLLDSFRFATAKLTVLLLGVPALHCLWP